MSRRLLGPVAGPVLFLLVAALVFGVLGWVTHSALQVEKAQREAAARAELGGNIRNALWRLDSRMLPALGVEDSRPFYHYDLADPAFGVGVAATPLLVTTLPDWMKLHFQLDASGWQSPQVLPADVVERIRLAWPDLPLRNVNADGEAALADLRKRFPAAAALDSFASRDHSLPAEDVPLANPPVVGGVVAPVVPASGPTPPLPQPPGSTVTPTAPAAVQSSAALDRRRATFRLFGIEVVRGPVPTEGNPVGNNTNNTFFNNAYRLDTEEAKKAENPNQAAASSRQQQAIVSPGRMATPMDNDRGTIQRGLRDVQAPPPTVQPKGQGVYNNFANGSFANNYNYPSQGGNDLKNSVVPGVAAGPQGSPTDNTAQFANPAMPGRPGVGGAAGQPGAAVPQSPRASGVAPAGPPLAAPRAHDEPEKVRADKAAREKAIPPMTPPPALPALVAEVPPPWNVTAPVPPSPQPVAIHLGSMRPQWLTGADGAELLALVRVAKVDDKTVCQGIILDWPRLEAMLEDEVKDLFPDAKLVPVREIAEATPDRLMTSLPVQFDPGLQPELPPAGWTTLRLGLALAWAAALVAVVAVGFCGWTLIDLAERRIRFVSAVTHELRTPLTSLRLYLDMLVSGMVQDEAKRQEYLNTLSVESDRLHRLIDNVLDFAKLEKRRPNGDIQPTAIAELLEQVRSTWTGRLAQDGRELVVIATVPGGQLIRTDPAMFQQIVGNLVDNARKYARDAVDKRIWVWAKPLGTSAVAIEVEDRGPGVPAAERRSVFKPFRRGDRADRTSGGAGLGLALAKSWAEVLGGRLTYRPADGGAGACFRLELPVG